ICGTCTITQLRHTSSHGNATIANPLFDGSPRAEADAGQQFLQSGHGMRATLLLAFQRRGLSMIYDSILGTIGRTPIVKIQRLAPKNITMYAKCEFFNPMSSVKDRLAIAIIEDAERTGKLKPGQTVVEATSGNTGIALAMVCAAKGYPFVATMAESFSVER